MSEIFKALAEADPLKSWWPFVVSVAVGVIMTIKTAMGGQACSSECKLENRIVLLTNATDEVSIAVARDLCKRDVDCLILAVNDTNIDLPTLDELKKKFPNVRVEIRKLDVSSWECVKTFVRSIETDFSKIDILINNESALASARNEKYENMHRIYLAQTLLTVLLTPLLRKSNDGRVINVVDNSYAHTNLTNESMIEDFLKTDSIANANLGLIIATIWFAQIFKDNADLVTINACTTGSVMKEEDLPKLQLHPTELKKLILFPINWLLMKTPMQGAQTIIYLAVEPNIKAISGELFNDNEKQNITKIFNDISIGDKLMDKVSLILDIPMNLLKNQHIKEDKQNSI